MLLCGEKNLRVVVLSLVNQRAEDLMMGAPSEASPRRLGGAAYSGGEAQCQFGQPVHDAVLRAYHGNGANAAVSFGSILKIAK
jgi:hypothetical protein